MTGRRPPGHRRPEGDSGRRGDPGASLVELSVTIAIGSVVLLAVAAIFVSLVGTIRSTSQRADRATNAQVGRETIDRSLRAADSVPPVTEGTGKVLLDAQATELTLTTGFPDATAAAALASDLDTKVSGSAWAAELRATGLVPRRVRYRWLANAAGCGSKNGIVEELQPIASTTYSATTQTFSVTWGAVSRTRCVLRTDLAPQFTYFSDCAGTTPVTAPVASALLATVDAVDYSFFPGTKAETLGRVCLVNSS